MKNTIRLIGITAFAAVMFISIAACASTGKGESLAAPQNVTVTETEVRPPYRDVTVSWSAVEGAERYRVDMVSAIGGVFSREITETSYKTGFHPGEDVYFEITALRGRRVVGEKSERVTITTSPETQEDIDARAEIAARAAAESAAREAARADAAAEAERARAIQEAIENSPEYQQLIGRWNKTGTIITFPERLNDYFYDDSRSGTITSYSLDAITVDFGGGHLGILTFNYAISGDSLTISNWTLGGREIENRNGVYTRYLR